MAEKSLDLEKPGLDEAIEDAGYSDPRITAFTPKEQKRIIFRVDCRLVLTLGFLYMISLVDRTNLGAASIAGYVDSPKM
jgi:hypothetical protein